MDDDLKAVVARVRAGLRAGYHFAQSPQSYSEQEHGAVFDQIAAGEIALSALLSALRQRDEALEAVLPLAQEMMVIARACGEGGDPFAAWETIFPAVGAEYGDGSLEDGEPDHPSIEQARAILTGSETQ